VAPSQYLPERADTVPFAIQIRPVFSARCGGDHTVTQVALVDGRLSDAGETGLSSL
jgi:hypothetical protein